MRHLMILAMGVVSACGPYEAPDLAILTPDELAQHPAVGCWSFPAMRGEAFLATQTRVRLDTAALERDYGAARRRLVLEATEDTALIPRISVANWGPLPASRSAVYLVWGDGFGGFAIEGEVQGDSLFGRARGFTDFPAPFTWRRVSAVRVPCASDSPSAAGATPSF